MTISDIHKLIAHNETRQVELKKSTGELKDAMHSACAFLNTDGGWLLFGITPNSLKVVGQEVTENTRRELAQALAGLEPAVDVRVEYVDVPDRPGMQVIALGFDAWVWGKEPFTFHGRPYYRVESTTQVMPRDMFDDRLRASKPQKFAWERQPAEGLKLDDLNQERIRGAVRLGVEMGRMSEMAFTEPVDKILEKWRLLVDGVPNNAAAMLFTDNTYDYPQFILRLARFRGNDKLEFIDNQRVEGNFFVLLDAGMSFFFKHLSLSGKIVGFKREEHLEVPSEALREALINALCHRQYEKYNLTIGIAIYDDRIEIENPGIFPPQITLANIKESHGSYPYNPLIAEVLYKTSYLESWGSGVKRIVDACRKQNVPDPEWSLRGGFVTVTFWRGTQTSDSKGDGKLTENPETGQENKKNGQESQETGQGTLYTGQATGQAAGQAAGQVTGQVNSLLLGLGNKVLSVKELMGLLNKHGRDNFMENYIRPALRDNLIAQTHPENIRHWDQKYYLTEKGMELLKSKK